MSNNDEIAIIKLNISEIVKQILTKGEEFTPEDIDSNSNLLEDFGIESLTQIEKLMALEEYFEIDIPDGEIENLITVNTITNFIFEKLSEEKRNSIKTQKDIVVAIDELKQGDTHTVKQIRNILTSSFFSKLQKDLGLHVNSVFILLRNLLKDNKIEHVSTIPDYDENERLKIAYILFLTKKQLYYIGLRSNILNFREFGLDDLSIETSFHFDKKGNIKKMEITVDVGDLDDKGRAKKYEYTMVPPFINVTIKLISKITKFKELIGDEKNQKC